MEITSEISRLIVVQAGDQSEVGNARRQAFAIASKLDFSELRCGQIGIIVTEAARNLSAHGGGGELLLTPWTRGAVAGIDVLALDKGPGIADIAAALRDGYSTGSTPGTGLGAMERLASSFGVFSQPHKGTVVFARILRSEKDQETAQAVQLGSVVVPVAGETLCGDAWSASLEPERQVYLMADGLGHGPVASDAAQEAVTAFRRHCSLPPKEILVRVHEALRKTLGAAVAIAEVLPGRGVLHYAGSGNIASTLCGAGRSKSLVSMNGTPGHNMGTVQEFSYPWKAGDTLLMHTDGVATRWDLAGYPGLASRDPSLVAGVLLRDFSRKRDDATVLVAGYHP